jgi:hypothetical protein
MNDITQLAVSTTEKRGLALIFTRDRAHQNKTDLICSLILTKPLFIVSGDEWLPAFELPQRLREHTSDIKAVLDRLHAARASTCYRLLDVLATIPSQGEPVLVLEFLDTFYDADIPLRTRLFCLRECCRELKRLAFYRPVIVMIQEHAAEEYEKFIPALLPLADQTFTLEPDHERINQPALF